MPSETTGADPRAAVDDYLTAHLEEALDDLARLCRQPSVAAQQLGMAECAELTATLLRAHGFTAEVLPTGGAPVVYGEAPGASDKTLLCYNHYDVQPAEPLDLWQSPPFEPTRRDGRLYARGVSDDKGHIVSRLAAIRALRAVHGELPCRVKFIIEGEEEIGSTHLPAFIAAHRNLLAADGCLWEFGMVDYEGRPTTYLGMRGDFYVELAVRALDHDAHSGLGGSIFPNAAWRLVWALATLKGPDELITIPGWYDDVREPSARDLELLARLPDDEARLKESFGLDRFLGGATGVALRRQAVFVPTCTISGLTSGYQGPGSKTVLPAAASAKVDFRLVPEQNPADLLVKLRRHLDERGFADVEIAQLGGERAARTDPDAPFVRLVAATAQEVYGQPLVLAPLSGGSGPMHPFVKYLGVPIANAGIGSPNSNAHAPNEFIVIDEFLRGARHVARIIAGMAGL
ncbi:MAG TPA: M20/M25/M40 family metallo-hydrolase [Thermomicrobiales bacterium]|nr:M20/M25/M40 family metallo-hydrolase [Thermomicrobiales bacterium]